MFVSYMPKLPLLSDVHILALLFSGFLLSMAVANLFTVNEGFISIINFPYNDVYVVYCKLLISH